MFPLFKILVSIGLLNFSFLAQAETPPKAAPQAPRIEFYLVNDSPAATDIKFAAYGTGAPTVVGRPPFATEKDVKKVESIEVPGSRYNVSLMMKPNAIWALAKVKKDNPNRKVAILFTWDSTLWVLPMADFNPDRPLVRTNVAKADVDALSAKVTPILKSN